MDSVTTVPLKKLTLSDRNVRKTVHDRDIADIAAAIEARGLDQNLVVIPSAHAGTFEVIAGGLRYRALLKLLAAKKIRSDHPVPVKIAEPDEARVISLSENIDRVAMNPADEIEAFAAIVAEHADDADPIAFASRRTGRSRDVIEQRVRLSKLPAEILDALRQGTIGIAAANAYGAVPDPDQQLLVFKAEEDRKFGEKHRPSLIRDALKGRTVPADCPRARYVGLDAYKDAGGRTDRDLFMTIDAGEMILDPSLLDQLAKEKAEGELAGARQHFGLGGAVLTPMLVNPASWPKTPAGYMPRSSHDPVYALEDLDRNVRAAAIGVFTLDDAGESLEPIGWFQSIAITAPTPAADRVADEPTATPDLGERHRAYFPAGGQGGDRIARPGAQLANRALELVAARIAAEHLVGGVLADHAVWPNEKHGFVPPLDTAIGDADTFLVTVQIRLPRAEVEAHLHEAEEQIEANAQANDHVDAASAEPVPMGAGGGGDESPPGREVREVA